MAGDTAGDPCSGIRWTRRTTRSIASELDAYGITISDRTVSRILREQGYSLRVNHKKLSGTKHPDRDQQFTRIQIMRTQAAHECLPILSVDTKKKELVGRFRNPGTRWGRTPELVNDHDFRSLADGIAIPYGVYDLHANAGAFYVGTSYDTPEFAVDCIADWWQEVGKPLYPHARKLCLLADSGGSNGCRPRAWKYFLQHRLVNPFQITVTVTHYPSGTSKWNPIEHRLFSEVSKNWAGVPLESMEIILNYLRTTTTRTGLTVTAKSIEKAYEKGRKISADEMGQLNLEHHPDIPRWNYCIKPQLKKSIALQLDAN